MQKLLTTAEVADLLGKSISTVIYRTRLGELKYAQKLPGQTGAYLYDPAVVEAARQADATAEQATA